MSRSSGSPDAEGVAFLASNVIPTRVTALPNLSGAADLGGFIPRSAEAATHPHHRKWVGGPTTGAVSRFRRDGDVVDNVIHGGNSNPSSLPQYTGIMRDTQGRLKSQPSNSCEKTGQNPTHRFVPGVPASFYSYERDTKRDTDRDNRDRFDVFRIAGCPGNGTSEGVYITTLYKPLVPFASARVPAVPTGCRA